LQTALEARLLAAARLRQSPVALLWYHTLVLPPPLRKSLIRRIILIILRSALLALLIGCALLPTSTIAQAGKNTVVGKIPALLEKSGFKYAKVKEGVWQIDFQGKNLKEFHLTISLVSDQLIMFVDLADRGTVNFNNGLAVKLLELNDAMDTVKFALSEKSLYGRMEVHERILDLQELKYMVNQMSAAMDEAFPQIKPFLQ
jgi:hypothetical protein